MKKLVALALIGLTGCSILPHRVRYVTTYCLNREQYETLRRQQPDKFHDRLTGVEDKDILIITANAIRLRSYSDGLLEVLGGCQDPKGN